MATNNNTSSGIPGKFFVNGVPVADIKNVEITEAPKEDPAKEDEPVLYFNNSPEMKFQGELRLTKKEKRKLDKVYKKTIGRLKVFKKKAEVAIIGNDKPMRKRELNKKLKQHNKFLTGKGKAADFSNAILYCVDLSGANLSEACFRGTTFWAVKFNGADLAAADFTGAHFITTDVSDADLSGACLKGITVDKIFANENTKISVPLFCPSSGSFIGWKKAFYGDPNLTDYYPTCIVKLLIPEDAKRSSAFGEKCRCDKAVILEAYDCATGCPLEESTVIRSARTFDFAYHIGDTITIPDFDDNRWEECSYGFHFFIDEESAKNYRW